MKRPITAVITLFLLGGCAIGPDYRKPDIASPPGWLVGMQKAQDTANTAQKNSAGVSKCMFVFAIISSTSVPGQRQSSAATEDRALE